MTFSSCSISVSTPSVCAGGLTVVKMECRASTIDLSSNICGHFVADLCEKIVESLWSKKKNQFLISPLSERESRMVGNGSINDELDLRIASVLQSTRHCYDGGFWTDHSKNDMTDQERHVAIVMTGSFPWMTDRNGCKSIISGSILAEVCGTECDLVGSLAL